jgi:hypothetical protein
VLRNSDASRLRGCVPHISSCWRAGSSCLTPTIGRGRPAKTCGRRPATGRATRPPQPGDDLVFPQLTGTAPFVAANNFPSGTSLDSITIAGSGYELPGNQVELVGGIAASDRSDTSSDNLNTVLGGGPVTVTAGGTLDLGGGISGMAGPFLARPGHDGRKERLR